MNVADLEPHALTPSAVNVHGLHPALAGVPVTAFQDAGASSQPLKVGRKPLSLMLASAVLLAGLEGATLEHHTFR